MSLLFPAGKSVKDKIIITLGYLWPLKAREILSYIKHNFNANITYQAVYKSVNELVDEGVVVKTSDGLMLNKEWVGSLKDYAVYVDQSYKSGIPKKDIVGSGQTTVSCIWDWYYYVLSTMEKLSKDEYATKTPMVLRTTHEWNALFFGKEDMGRVMGIIRKYNIFANVCIENPFAKTLTKYWEDMGVHFARVDPSNFPSTSSDIIVIGDYVIQAMYPKELLDALFKFFDETCTLKEMDITKCQKDVFYKKTDLHVITVKNKVLADSLRKEILAFFDKK